jgi:pimeloyl-ACP methyl ester carboxylesterase
MTDIRTRSVTSNDGTTIGYLELGRGPGLVVLHGAMVSAQSFTQLADALADSHTVYVPDRRGRGLSGPFGPGYDIDKEVEDLNALLTTTGAHDVFAVSVGALVCLQAALVTPEIQRMALWEPALPVDGSFSPSLTRFDQEVADGNLAAALVTGMFEAQIAPPALNAMPREQLVALTEQGMQAEDAGATPGEVTQRMLAPTLHYDLQLIQELRGTLDSYREVHARVLLLGGSEGPAWSKLALDALDRVLPDGSRVELPGLDHGGPTNPGPTNHASNPALVAQVLARFFDPSLELASSLLARGS